MSNSNLEVIPMSHTHGMLGKLKNLAEFTEPKSHELLEERWNELGNPDMFGVNTAKGLFVFIANPIIIDEAVNGSNKDLIRGKYITMLANPNADNDLNDRSILRKYGLFAIETSPEYQFIQKILRPSFNGRQIKNYSMSAAGNVDDILGSWPDGEEVNEIDIISEYTFNNAAGSFLGLAEDDLKREHTIIKRVVSFLTYGPKRLFMENMLPGPLVKAMDKIPHGLKAKLEKNPKYTEKLEKLPKFTEEQYNIEREFFFDEFLIPIVQSRLNDYIDNQTQFENPANILDSMIVQLYTAKQQQENGELEDAPFTITETLIEQILVDEIASFMLAGIETSWATMISAEAEITEEVENKIVSELEEKIRDAEITYDNLGKLEYLEGYIDWILAKYPPAINIPREAKVDTSLGGYAIPKGAVVMSSVYLAHRRVFPNIDRMSPEDFLKINIKGLSRSILSFGKGPRACIGQGFAMMQIKMFLAKRLQAKKLEVLKRTGSVRGAATLTATKTLVVRTEER